MPDTIIKENNNVELPPEPAKAPEALTREDARKANWSQRELDSAEKRGMFGKPQEKAPEPEKDPANLPEPAKAETPEPEVAAGEKKEAEVKPAAKGGSLPEYTFTAEEEGWIKEKFGKGHPVRAFYFRAKNERSTRQKIEAELSALKAKFGDKTTPEPTLTDEDDLDKPLTVRALQDLKKREQEEAEREKQLHSEHQNAVNSAQVEQETYAKEILPDYEPTTELAKEVMRNIEAWFPEKRSRQKVLQLMQEFQVAAYRANEFELEDRHAAFVIYELGQMHPQYGKTKAPVASAEPKDGTSKENPKAPGSPKPETTLERIEKNTQRRASSASVPGGGAKRVVSADDVTVADLNAMDFSKRKKFRDQFPDHYAKLVRG